MVSKQQVKNRRQVSQRYRLFNLGLLSVLLMIGAAPHGVSAAASIDGERHPPLIILESESVRQTRDEFIKSFEDRKQQRKHRDKKKLEHKAQMEKISSPSWIESVQTMLYETNFSKGISQMPLKKNPHGAMVENLLNKHRHKQYKDLNTPSSKRRKLQSKMNDNITCIGGIINGVCRVSGTKITFPKDIVFKNSEIESLVLEDTQFECRKSNGRACKISIELTNKKVQPQIVMTDTSYIKGSEIYIYAKDSQLIIDRTSYIGVSGASYSKIGSDTDKDQAASYIGEGGYCGTEAGQEDKTYGSFDLRPTSDVLLLKYKDELQGSRGMSGEAAQYTLGGGRIYIDVDSVKLDGEGVQLSANGDPESKEDQKLANLNLHGGSGGYIYIKTYETNKKNEIDPLSQIQAIGGFGKNQGHGGAGGVIVYDGSFDYGIGNSHVHGGKGGISYEQTLPLGCSNGASGTVYWKENDSLFIDNKEHVSNKKTFVKAVHNRDVAHWANQNMVVHDLVIGHSAHVHIDINISKERTEQLFMPYIELKGESSVKFVLPKKVEYFHLMYHNHFKVGPKTLLDFTDASLYTNIKNFNNRENPPVEGVDHVQTMELGNIKFTKAFKIEVSRLNIKGDITDVQAQFLTYNKGYIEFITTELYIYEAAKLYAQHMFFFSLDIIDLDKDVQLKSSFDNECTPRTSKNEDLYTCMDYEKNSVTPLSKWQIISHYNNQYGWYSYSSVGKYPEKDGGLKNRYAVNGHAMKTQILDKWNIYLIGINKIKMDSKSFIQAPRVGLCGNNIEMNESVIDTNFRGCKADEGHGNIARKSAHCAGSGASHGGKGGMGASDKEDDVIIKMCKETVQPPYWQGREARFEGSGGTSGDSKIVKGQSVPGDNGGSGGGIIWLTSTDTITMMKSNLRADGLGGEQNRNQMVQGSGGGSGGSIQLTMKNLVGDGTHLNLAGGRGSSNGGGGGSGGRLVINYLTSYLKSSYPMQSHFWTGSENIRGGASGHHDDKFAQLASGQDGTIFSSRCFPGYSGPFCKACPVGTYQPNFSFGQCLECINKPDNSEYHIEAETKSMCRYKCAPVEYIESVESNEECLDPVSLEYVRMGGAIPFFSLLLVFLFMALTMFGLLTWRAGIIKESLKDLPETIYEVWEENDESNRGKTLEDDYGLKDQCIWAHTHRMYLIGSNSIRFPWYIPKDFPRDALTKQDREKFIAFIEHFNTALKWNVWERCAFYLVKFFYFPMSKPVHAYLRRNKFKALQISLYRSFSPQFWGDKKDNKTMRLGCSKDDDCLAYIDFLDFSKSRDNWLGLKLPMPLLAAGAGTFNHPYKIDYINDTYAKSLVLIDQNFFADKLPVFLENFNSQLGKLSFYKLQTQVMRDLYTVVKWLEDANKCMFNHFNVKCVLYICENQFSEMGDGQFKQKRRSFPLESIFFDCFPILYSSLLRYVKARLTSHKSEMRLLLVFKRYSRSKQIGTSLRVNMMNSTNPKQAYKVAVERDESVLFDETDTDEMESKITYANMSMSSMNSSNNGSMASIHQLMNDKSGAFKSVKLVDKTKRAFSYSIDSSKAFELAVRKPRKKCKHHVNSCRTGIYGMYLLLMKSHGAPPKSKDLTVYFLIYSAILALDILLLIQLTFHCVTPSKNFHNFGWVFFFVMFGVPFFSPLFAYLGAIFGSQQLFKLTGNMNSMTIVFNIPLTALMLVWKHDDVIYLLILTFMLVVKSALSFITAKIRMYMSNPRFASNNSKLVKILSRQAKRLDTRENILGKQLTEQIDVLGDDNSVTKNMLLGINSLNAQPNQPMLTPGDIDYVTMRNKLLDN